jgi:hypothetical protein
MQLGRWDRKLEQLQDKKKRGTLHYDFSIRDARPGLKCVNLLLRVREEGLSVCTQCVAARQQQPFQIKERKKKGGIVGTYVLILLPFSCYISLALFSTFHSFLVRSRNVDKGNGSMQRNIQSVTGTHIFRTLLSRDTIYIIQAASLQAKAYRKMSTQTKVKSFTKQSVATLHSAECDGDG